MCRATATSTTSTAMVAELSRKRRLGRSESSVTTTASPAVAITPPSPPSATAALVEKKHVRFLVRQEDDDSDVHFVEPICTPYNKRLLFYTKLELDRLLQMEIRQNMAYGPRLISRVGDYHSDDLTWRGIEQFQPGNDPSSRRANASSLVQIITREYKNNKMNHRAAVVDPDELEEQLRFLSEALSEPEREQARQRGIQDEDFVWSPPPPASCRAPTTTGLKDVNIVMKRSTATSGSSIIGGCMSWGIISFMLKAGSTTWYLEDHLLWIVRVVGLFVFCGFFVTKS